MSYITPILKKYKHLSKQEKIIKFFETIRDIPYGEYIPRSPQNSLKYNKGTCSTKNLILRDLYKAIGVQTQVWLCSFQYKQSKKFTPEMNALLENPLTIYHTFIKIKVNKKWIIVDSSNDPGLAKIGAYVQTNWDGQSDIPLAVKPILFFHAEDSEAFKKKQYVKLSKAELKRKDAFMNLFFDWIDNLRK